MAAGERNKVNERKLHGAYMGLLNGLPRRLTRLARKLNKEKGMRAAVAWMRKQEV